MCVEPDCIKLPCPGSQQFTDSMLYAIHVYYFLKRITGF